MFGVSALHLQTTVSASILIKSVKALTVATGKVAWLNFI